MTPDILFMQFIGGVLVMLTFKNTTPKVILIACVSLCLPAVPLLAEEMFKIRLSSTMQGFCLLVGGLGYIFALANAVKKNCSSKSVQNAEFMGQSMIIIKLKQRMAVSIGLGFLISVKWLFDRHDTYQPLDLETAIGLVIIAHSCWVLLTIRSFESRAEKGEGGM